MGLFNLVTVLEQFPVVRYQHVSIKAGVHTL
jgi:hypothetical protein